ncbi:MAG: DUF1549 domain-containing protein, partial [Planctomycetes bacterium]|nr:DUF1549 domain-containing protein [Planctomycetota bacterium]
MRYPWLRWSLLLFPALLAWPAHGAVAESAANDFFEKEVRPLLVERCFRCHGGEKTRGSLKLTSRAEILQGGAHGPAAVPGQPAQSLLIRALHYTDSLRMPRDGKLPDRDIDILTRWVQEGLPWPQAGPQLATARGPQAAFTDEQRRFWCFQPVKIVPPPAVKDMAWPRSDIDRFILAALEARGLKPAPPAGKRTLIRRATYDLTGLPPTPREIDAFLADSSPDAFAKEIGRASGR